jgi:hypothetical protein
MIYFFSYLIDLAIKYQSYLLINDPNISIVNTFKIWLIMKIDLI